MSKKIFIAAPMSSFNNENYIKNRRVVLEIITEINRVFSNIKVFYAGDKLNEQKNFQDPIESIKSDLHEVDAAEIFILIYLEAIPSSALIETGYAIKGNKEIGVFTDKRETLPFIIRKMDFVHSNVKIFEVGEFLLPRIINFIKLLNY